MKHGLELKRVVLRSLPGLALIAMAPLANATPVDYSGIYSWTDTTSGGTAFTFDATIVENPGTGAFTWSWDNGSTTGTGSILGQSWTLNASQPGTGLTAQWPDPTGSTDTITGGPGAGTVFAGSWTQSDGEVGTTRATFSAPVPLPPAAILLLTGIVGVLGLSRRRRGNDVVAA